ncbi:MAG: ATP-binding cassette domain-containing protein [Candidatus Muiribacteriota bacterium]
MKSIIKIKNVNKSFENKKILNNISLDIYEGECLCIMGRSGCGKSVLMKIITGLYIPDSGEVFFRENKVDFESEIFMRNYRKNFGLVFQNGALFDSMNVFDNISFGLKYNMRFNSVKIKKIVFQILEELRLVNSAYVFPDALSGGMKKRVALARALVMNPEILIYDEPTTGLDAVMVRNIDKLIKETQLSRKTTSIVITHDVNSAERIADRIAIHSDGKIVEAGSREEIFSSSIDTTKTILTGIENE